MGVGLRSMEDVRSHSSMATLSSIHRLTLHGNELESLGSTLSFPQLQHLNVSSNRLMALDGLAFSSSAPHLERLDAAANDITSVSRLDALEGLQSLNLSFNQSLSSLSFLISSAPLSANSHEHHHHDAHSSFNATALAASPSSSLPNSSSSDDRAAVAAAAPSTAGYGGGDLQRPALPNLRRLDLRDCALSSLPRRLG